MPKKKPKTPVETQSGFALFSLCQHSGPVILSERWKLLKHIKAVKATKLFEQAIKPYQAIKRLE